MRIWPVGTNRILGVIPSESEIVPEVIKQYVNWDTRLYGDFEVCPFTKEKPGEMQIVCVEAASKLVGERFVEGKDAPITFRIGKWARIAFKCPLWNRLRYLAEAWFAAGALLIAFAPRPLKFRFGILRKSGPEYYLPGWREWAYRTLALAIGLTILADLVVQLVGRPPFLH
jgi:hypothetical protein